MGLCVYSSPNFAKRLPYMRLGITELSYFARIEYIPPIKKKEPVKIAVV